MSDRIIETGDLIRIRANDKFEWVRASVQLASKNGQSIAVFLDSDSALRTADGGMYIGVVPLMVDYEKEEVTDLAGHTFEIDIADVPLIFRGAHS